MDRFKLTEQEIFFQDLTLILFTLVLLPCIGKIADLYGRRKIMLIGAFFTFSLSYIIFQFVQDNLDLNHVLFLRFVLETAAIFIAAPFCGFIAILFPSPVRTFCFSVVCGLGSFLFVMTTPFITFYLENWTHDAASPGAYLAFVAFICWVALLKVKPYLLKIVETQAPPLETITRPAKAA